MTYLGRRFSFSSDLDIDKSLIVTSTTESLSFDDSLPVGLSPMQKCHALNLHIQAHLSFPLLHFKNLD